MKKFFYASFAVIALCFWAGCTKSGSSGPSATFTLLSSGKWQLKSDTAIKNIPGGGTTTEDEFAKLPLCTADNYFLFNSTGTFTTDEGSTKCDASDPQTKLTGIWLLTNGDTQLQIPDPVTGLIVTGLIIQLDDNVLKFRYITDIGVTATNTQEYKHIK